MRHVPLIGTLLLFAIAGGWRPWLQYRRHGSSGFLLFRSGGLAHRLRDAGGVLLFTLLFAQAIVAAASPSRPHVRVARDTVAGLLLPAPASC